MKSGVAADWNIIAKKTATSNWPLADRKLSLIFWIPAQGRNDKFVSGVVFYRPAEYAGFRISTSLRSKNCDNFPDPLQ